MKLIVGEPKAKKKIRPGSGERKRKGRGRGRGRRTGKGRGIYQAIPIAYRGSKEWRELMKGNLSYIKAKRKREFLRCLVYVKYQFYLFFWIFFWLSMVGGVTIFNIPIISGWEGFNDIFCNKKYISIFGYKVLQIFKFYVMLLGWGGLSASLIDKMYRYNRNDKKYPRSFKDTHNYNFGARPKDSVW